LRALAGEFLSAPQIWPTIRANPVYFWCSSPARFRRWGAVVVMVVLLAAAGTHFMCECAFGAIAA
jgi:hypothetical protein